MNSEKGELLASRYEVDEELGAGGMGIVLQCHDRETGDQVAVKLLKPERQASDTASERLLQEARAVSALTSRHVARVRDAGRLESGRPYLVMDLLVGQTLRAELVAKVRLPAEESCNLAQQVCAALAEAHAVGIVHRDVKPSNLHVDREGDAPLLRVLDFGIAKVLTPSPTTPESLTATGTVMGSPGYMSPEQLRDAKSVDARSDIWSLGVVLYEMLAGHPPFEAESAEGLCAMIAADPTPPLSNVDAALSAVVMRCLRKNRAERFVNVTQLAKALSPFAGAGAADLLVEIRRFLPDAFDASDTTIDTSDTSETEHVEVPPAPLRRLALGAGLAMAAIVGVYVALPSTPVREPQPLTPTAVATDTVAREPRQAMTVATPTSAAAPHSAVTAATEASSATASTAAASTAAPSNAPTVKPRLPATPRPLPRKSQPPKPEEVVDRNDPLDDRR